MYTCVNEESNFWGKLYLVSFDNHTGWDSAICVNASNEQDAIDAAADYAESKGWLGYFVEEKDVRTDKDGEEIDTIRVGNYSRPCNVEDVNIKRIDESHVTFVQGI